MSDTRERLIALLKGREDWHPDDLAEAVNAILAEFLVVSRSDIEGYEFGYRGTAGDGQAVRGRLDSRDWAERFIRTARQAQVERGQTPDMELITWPAIVPTAIPLPEGGQS